MFNMGNMMGAVPTVMMNPDRNNDNGWGEGWWALIILFALFGGWGNSFGWSGNGGGNGGWNTTAIDASLQRGFDTAEITSKLDGINNGICSLGYDQLAQMNGINTNIMQTGFGLQQGLNANNIAQMQNTNALSTQLANCCCENREAIAQVRYDMATDTCAITNTINQAARDLQESNCQNFRDLSTQIQNGFNNLERNQMMQQISELQAKLNACDRDNALQAMGQYVVNQVRPTPIPSWNVPNPWVNYGYNGYNGCGNGCCNF